MSEKVTAYDISYLQDNPYKQITERLILDNAMKAEPRGNSSFALFNKIKLFFSSQQNANEYDTQLKNKAEALTYDEWLEACQKLDELENNVLWKNTPESEMYDFKLLQKEVDTMREYRLNKDYESLLYLIRTRWTRDFAGITNDKLYSVCHVGTKKLISDYNNECIACLELLVSSECNLDDHYILDTLMESKRKYGRTAITMSGGGTFGMMGIGVFATLLEHNLCPKIIAGSSGGSIVCSIVCSKTPEELKEILSNIFDTSFKIFQVDNDTDSTYLHLSRLLKYGVWFDSTNLQETMKGFLGNMTFKEAFNKTGRILNVTVSSATVHDQPTLLNYLTAPNVLIWSAVCASCSLPVVFASSTIYEKNMETGEIYEWSNSSLKFVDGSINSDLPIIRLSEMFNVNHTIACQVNPHISPWIKIFSGEIETRWKRLFHGFTTLLTFQISHFCDVFTEIGICSNLATKIKRMFLQSYTGNITILPEIQLGEQPKILINPTPSFMWEVILRGARATWSKLEMIKNQYTVEFALDKSISILKSRVVFESGTLKRNDSIYTMSPKFKFPNDENVSPFSSRTNIFALKKKSKPEKRMSLRYEHSFESLLHYSPKGENKARKKHSKSFSYTQLRIRESSDSSIKRIISSSGRADDNY
ncbi:hypothetical protein CANINC_001061 [Pichia inconspicua]|uniref:PNPLA domain-containing protein n=1 Tax=Pichia inconspicua TaxID=52247 RepID=A0A4T0X4M3_9ASCO|nr:hypothetical protein CANINC_001061 [[Candida] inconspicua]